MAHSPQRTQSLCNIFVFLFIAVVRLLLHLGLNAPLQICEIGRFAVGLCDGESASMVNVTSYHSGIPF